MRKFKHVGLKLGRWSTDSFRRKVDLSNLDHGLPVPIKRKETHDSTMDAEISALEHMKIKKETK